MLDSLEVDTLLGLGILAAILLFGLIWLMFNFIGADKPWQQMFCPEDRSTCHCRSCREEREN